MCAPPSILLYPSIGKSGATEMLWRNKLLEQIPVEAVFSAGSRKVGKKRFFLLPWKHAQPCQVSTQRVFQLMFVQQNLLPNASTQKKYDKNFHGQKPLEKHSREVLHVKPSWWVHEARHHLNGQHMNSHLKIRPLTSLGKIDSTSIDTVYQWIQYILLVSIFSNLGNLEKTEKPQRLQKRLHHLKRCEAGDSH